MKLGVVQYDFVGIQCVVWNKNGYTHIYIYIYIYIYEEQMYEYNIHCQNSLLWIELWAKYNWHLNAVPGETVLNLSIVIPAVEILVYQCYSICELSLTYFCAWGLFHYTCRDPQMCFFCGVASIVAHRLYCLKDQMMSPHRWCGTVILCLTQTSPKKIRSLGGQLNKQLRSRISNIRWFAYAFHKRALLIWCRFYEY